MDPYEVGLRLVARHSDMHGRPGTFSMLGLRWDLSPGVFAPIHTDSTELFANWLPFPEEGRFLEIGSGTGVIAVMAALCTKTSVTAVDLNPAAVRNTRLNAQRHHVDDRVQEIRSDLFQSLDQEEKFDTVFWNSNAIEAPPDFA